MQTICTYIVHPLVSEQAESFIQFIDSVLREMIELTLIILTCGILVITGRY